MQIAIVVSDIEPKRVTLEECYNNSYLNFNFTTSVRLTQSIRRAIIKQQPFRQYIAAEISKFVEGMPEEDIQKVIKHSYWHPDRPIPESRVNFLDMYFKAEDHMENGLWLFTIMDSHFRGGRPNFSTREEIIKHYTEYDYSRLNVI